MLNKNNIRNVYNKIHINKKLDNKILNCITSDFNISKMYIINKILKISCFLLFLLLSIGCGILIEKNSNKIDLEKIIDNDNKGNVKIKYNGIVNLPKNADLICSDNLSIDQLEKQLKINFLNLSDLVDSKISDCYVSRDDNNNIQSALLSTENNYNKLFSKKSEERTKPYFQYEISFNTNYSDQNEEMINTIDWYSTYPAETIDRDIEFYHLDNIDADIIMKTCDNIETQENVIFWPMISEGYLLYNNVLYKFKGLNMNRDTFISYLERITK